MDSSSLPRFDKYADIFYPVPPKFTPPFPVPEFGAWIPPERLLDNWSPKCFFHNLITTHKYTHLSNHASSLRDNIPCQVLLDKVIAGGQHICLKVEFDDGVIWLARIKFPACPHHKECVGGYGQQYFTSAAEKMESEIATLLYIASKTSVPVPKVYGWNLERDNHVGSLYMLMEYFEGETVEMRIKRHGGIIGKEVQRILVQLARYTAEISSLRFNRLARLRLDVDNGGTRWEYFTDTLGNPMTKASDFFEEMHRSRYRYKVSTPLTENWTNSTSEQRTSIAASIYQRTIKALSSHLHLGPFPLTHPDLNQQNILLSPSGDITSILDWENSRTVPLEVYDIRSHKLFKLWWQDWDGMDWTDGFALMAFREFESDAVVGGMVSRVQMSEGMGKVGRKLAFALSRGPGERGLKELVKSLEEVAVDIIPEDLAREILEYGK